MDSLKSDSITPNDLDFHANVCLFVLLVGMSYAENADHSL